VAATSPTNAWAVGRSKNGTTVQTLIEHWDGTAWTVQPSGTGGNHERLCGVAADSSSDAWAVGFANGRLQTLIEHWNGTAWTVQPPRGPAGSPQLLKGVAAVSPAAAWAVGRYDHGSDGFLTLIEAWNGTIGNH
jgi:hypothetical protein